MIEDSIKAVREAEAKADQLIADTSYSAPSLKRGGAFAVPRHIAAFDLTEAHIRDTIIIVKYRQCDERSIYENDQALIGGLPFGRAHAVRPDPGAGI